MNSVVLLDDNTFLIAGRADNTGVCLVMDQHGKILRTYHIESPYSEGGASVVGATIVGDQVVAATYDYETNKSFLFCWVLIAMLLLQKSSMAKLKQLHHLMAGC